MGTEGQGHDRTALLTMAGPLIGRQRELARVVELLADPAVRCVVLTGPSGVGKTKLALTALGATETADRVTVSLSAVRRGEVMADAVVAALGVAGDAAAGSPADTLWRTRAGRPVLLLLDNLEQVVDAAGVVLDLLDGYPTATVLATTIGELGVAGERVVHLGPLATSPRHRGPPSDENRPVGTEGAAAPPPAVAMFLDRVAAHDLTSDLTAVDHRAAEAICVAVGGLPLAIELAAARAGAVPLPLMARQLAAPSGLTLLDHGAAGGPDRHRTLMAALTWTTDLLPAPVAELLARMSVLEGPATLEGVAAVAPDGVAALDLLAGLIDLSLVDVDAGDPEEPRFALLPPVRAFAAERLEASGARDDAVTRHDRYLRVRCATGRTLRPHEIADVLAALDRARLSGSADAALELALAAARLTTAPGSRATVAQHVESLLEDPGTDSALVARALVWSASHLPPDLGGRETFAARTLDRVHQAIAAARTSGDVPALLDALELTIRTLPTTLDLALAQAGIEEGLDLAERHGDPGRVARFRMWVGMATLSHGQVQAAEALLRSAFSMGSHARDRVAADYAATFLHSMGATRTGLGGPPLPDLETLLASSRRHQDGVAAAFVLSLLVKRALVAGDIRSAAEHTLQLLPIGASRAVAEPLPSATMLTVPFRVLVAAGELSDAAVLHHTLDPLEPLLRNALAQADLLEYQAAVERLVPAAPSSPPPPPLPMQDAFRFAERRVAALALGPSADRARPGTVATAAAPESLTAREREVLLLLVDGTANRAIADQLGISHKTVMHHTVAIYRKLGVRGRTEAATWAVRTGLTSTDR